MSRYRFELATRENDAELRAVLSATPMDGRVSVSFRREPSFFDAAVVDGGFRQVVACRDEEENQLVGFGCRSVREMYVNGEPAAVGYLSSLRVLPRYRSLGLIARGYGYFRELHSDGRARLYVTTIAEGNERALAILTSGRAGLPRYHFRCLYHTGVIPIARRPRQVNGNGAAVSVRPATVNDLGKVVEFLRAVGPGRQFSPCYAAGDFFRGEGTFRDLEPEDLLLAFRGKELAGMLGGWNQRGFRQSVVEGYASHLRWSRPIYNTWAGLCGRPRLPAPGESFHYLNAALPVVRDGDVYVFEVLLKCLLARAAGGKFDYLLVGLAEGDPLLDMVKRYQTHSYVTRAYVVCWEDGEEALAGLDDRPLYLELGCL